MKLILFGSRARGDARPDSDYDVMVVLRGPVDPNVEIFRISETVSAVCLEHDVLITCVHVADNEMSADSSALFENVRREGVAV